MGAHARVSDESAFTPDQLEFVQEFVNISIGQSASALADLLDFFVKINVPSVEIAKTEELIEKLDGDSEGTVAVEQVFTGSISGQAILLVNRSGLANLKRKIFSSGELMQMQDDQAELEVLCEVGNMIIASTVGKFTELLGGQLTFSPPRSLPNGLCLDHQGLRRPNSRSALLIHALMTSEDTQVEFRLAILQDPYTSVWLRHVLQSAVDSLMG